MRRLQLGVVAIGLALSTGCLSLDGLFLATRTTDTYDLSSDVIPEEAWEVVSFESTDGTALSGVWAHREGGRPLIYFHGINNHVATESTKARLELYWQAGTHDVFAMDYRGFGTSDGKPSRDGVLEEDGLAAVRYVAETTGYDPAEIDWVALSLGGAVAIHTQDEIAARSVVLENVFPSEQALGSQGVGLDVPAAWFFEEAWDNVGEARKVTAPTFVIHGLADDFIDPAFAPDLHEALADPSFLWQPEGVNHDDIFEVAPEAYVDALGRFHADPYTDPSP